MNMTRQLPRGSVEMVKVCLFVCLLLNGTSALFRTLVPRIAEVEHMKHVKSICNSQAIKKRCYTNKLHSGKTMHLNFTIKSSFFNEIYYRTWGDFRKQFRHGCQSNTEKIITSICKGNTIKQECLTVKSTWQAKHRGGSPLEVNVHA